ncbi:MAG TPA: 1-phosphofructokinase family hexose kinase [Puia sp.]|nr:1-phosphofructokinase family hexose kinase [Puia sp.]
MPPIVTITFNPAIDKSTSISSLVPEKKLYCEAIMTEPGGGGINVARAIAKLGGAAEAIFLAGGHTGDLLQQLLSQANVPFRAIQMRNETREDLSVTDRHTNLQYRFVMPGQKVYEDEWQKCLQVVEVLSSIEYIVASGSLPQGVPDDIYARIASIAKKKNAKCIIDSKGKPLKLALEEGVYLIKPNLNELSILAGVNELKGEEIVTAAKDIIDKNQCEAIVISVGASGALLVTKDIVRQIAAPPVKTKSSVGAGDSMVAGIVYSLQIGKDIIRSVEYGVACGTASTLNEGTGLCNLADVENLYDIMSKTRNEIGEKTLS